MWTIAKLTFKEIISKRIFLITMIMTLLFLVLYGVAIHYAVKDWNNTSWGGGMGVNQMMQQQLFSSQLLSVGLYFSSFIVALLSILSSVSAIASEIDSHQIDTWLMRPITRTQFLLGKVIGLGGLLIAYAILLFAGILLIHQGIGGEAMSLSFSSLQIGKAILTYILQPIVLVLLGVMLSSRMTTLNAGIVLIIMYGSAFIGGFIEQIGTVMEKAALVNIGIISSLVFPVDAMYRKMTVFLFDTADNPVSLAQQGMFASASAPNNVMIVYTIVYGFIALMLALYSFKKRDL
ncbi:MULTISPECIES: ABC transporter permease subunit [Pontibacillus]|uniref:ABC transporter permease subunit n=1 Tax=Pontibacillus chungwhensis TaxID=265426 RepID=A0ABY8V2K4_9BACI|nr:MULTISPECIES: ABC transporter permease subunit [Pontibacillus]MCD5322387.1 ABC transporter permease [Pontibacillus sp. HN14]WIF99673.1 ABC transporter permease subunit [Pontibacillus chungwhensis]